MIFLGLLFDRSEERKIAEKSQGGFVQNQANTFQWNCIDGLLANGMRDLHIVNALPVGTYPKQFKELFLYKKIWKYYGLEHFQLGSINLPILKQFGRYFACKKTIKKTQDKDILIYSPYQPFLKAIKKLDESYRITLIVPDLPSFYDYSKTNFFRRILRKINNYSIEKCMFRIDRFVLLTDSMKEPLGVGSRPYMVLEGISTYQNMCYKNERSREKKVILYTGSLNKCFGVEVLLNAFDLIKMENYELWICGSGDFKNNVIESSKSDKRIKYFGFVSKSELIHLKSKANVLVNPRQNIGDYTKYSFPSKIMDYLLTGVPVVAYKLDGVPDEYDPYLIYVKDNSPNSLAEALIEVCEDSNGIYNEIAKKAVAFINNEKSAIKQAKRILDFINN